MKKGELIAEFAKRTEMSGAAAGRTAALADQPGIRWFRLGQRIGLAAPVKKLLQPL